MASTLSEKESNVFGHSSVMLAYGQQMHKQDGTLTFSLESEQMDWVNQSLGLGF